MNMNEVFFIKLSLKDAKIDHCNIKTEEKKIHWRVDLYISSNSRYVIVLGSIMQLFILQTSDKVNQIIKLIHFLFFFTHS